MTQIAEFETSQCDCTLYVSEWIFNGEKVYCCVSWHRANATINTRYGNKTQMNNILRTYNVDIRL